MNLVNGSILGFSMSSKPFSILKTWLLRRGKLGPNSLCFFASPRSLMLVEREYPSFPEDPTNRKNYLHLRKAQNLIASKDFITLYLFTL